MCKKYVACQPAYEQASQTVHVDTTDYEANGTCWSGADNAQLCDQRCTDALDAIRADIAAANLDVPACT